jgi:FtsP/CotA-like multicopper oxidase with cupredoxin domain
MGSSARSSPSIACPSGLFCTDTPISAVLAGGNFPGTLITANKGDNFAITIADQINSTTMLNTTSIHWHGLVALGYASLF